MSREYILAADLGTSVIKVTLFDSEGYSYADRQQEMSIQRPEPDAAEQDPDEYLLVTMKLIKEVIQQTEISPDQVAVLGISSQMGGAMAIDQDWNPLTKWHSPLELRSAPFSTEAVQNYGPIIRKFAGGTPYYLPKLLWWKNEYREMFHRADKFIILGAYVAGKMAGLSSSQAYMDESCIGFSGLSDTAHARWSKEIISEAGIPEDKLPQIQPSYEIIGHLTREAAESSELVEGTPIIAGVGDQVASFLGAGATTEGLIVDSTGSFSCFVSVAGEYKPDLAGNYDCLRSPHNNQYFLTSILIGTGISHRWLRDTLGEKMSFAEFDSEAEHADNRKNPLLFLPHMGGMGNPTLPHFRGAALGLGWSHERAHIYRAFLESVALDNLRTLIEMRKHFSDCKAQEVRVFGGGAKSRLWNQIKSDVLNIPHVTLNRTDLSLTGAMLLAGKAVGLFQDLHQAAQKVNIVDRVFQPREEYVGYYEKLFPLYKRACSELDSLFSGLREI